MKTEIILTRLVDCSNISKEKFIKYMTVDLEEAAKEKPVSFFDFDLEPGTNGISGNCILSCKKIDTNKLEACYEEVKDNKYFKDATGWEFVYVPGFRSKIKLILSKKMKHEYEKEETSLYNAIRNFYDGCKYFGD